MQLVGIQIYNLNIERIKNNTKKLLPCLDILTDISANHSGQLHQSRYNAMECITLQNNERSKSNPSLI